MLKRIVFVVVLLAIGGGVAALAVEKYCPGLWAWISRKTTEVTGWTEEARQADPVGYVEYAMKKLGQDAVAMAKVRRDLVAEIGQLADKLRQERALRDQARAMAEEFRAKYQQATTAGSFPIEVRGGAYTAEQAKSQVSMLLAEAEGYDAAVRNLEDVAKEAESQLEALTVRINKTESQLAAMSAQRELLRVRKLSSEGEKLLANVDALLHDNARAIAGSPVRTVRELAAAAAGSERKQANDRLVEVFLAQRPATPAETKPQAAPARPVKANPVGRSERPRANSAPKPRNAAPNKTERLGPPLMELGRPAPTGNPVSPAQVDVKSSPGAGALREPEPAEEKVSDKPTKAIFQQF